MLETDLSKHEETVLSSSTPSTQPITQNNIVPQPASQLSKLLKIILGIATFWPIFYICMFLLFFIIMYILGISLSLSFPGSNLSLESFFNLFSSLFYLVNEIIFYPTIILISILSFVYIINVFKNTSVSKGSKALWVAVFFQGIFGAFLLLAMKTIRNTNLLNLVIYLGVFIVTPYIAMPIYWNRYIRKRTQQNKVLENRLQKRSNYTFIVLYILYIMFFLTVPVLLFGPRTYTEYLKAEDLKKRRLIAFENTQKIKAYLPTWGKWSPRLDSSVGVVKFDDNRGYGYMYKQFQIAEINSPMTGPECNHRTYLELDKIFHEYRPVSEKLWLEKCEELLISGEKSVLSKNGWLIENQGSSFYAKEFLIVFDKESTRIVFHYKDTFLADETPSLPQTQSDLIGIVEKLRPVNAKDFGL